MKTFKPKLRRTKIPKKKVWASLLRNPLLAVRELNNRSFYEFLKFMWSEVSQEEFQDNWHIKYLCDTLQKLAEEVAVQKSTNVSSKQLIEDLTINVPPGTSKTTIVMIMFPAWCWTRWYWMKFIGLSYSATLSLESAESSRDLIRSQKYRSVYPDINIKSDKDQKSNFRVTKTFDKKPGYPVETRLGGNRFSTSVGGTVTGFHAHIILVDDPVNPQQAISPVQLASTNRWMQTTLPTRKVHKKYSPTVMIMQRVHENDPTGNQLEEDKGVQHICLPGEIKNYKKEVKPPELVEMYSEDGLLDPVRMDWEALRKLEAKLGQYGFAGQIGQSPTPPTGGMFKVDKFVITDQMPASNLIEMVVRYWDKAGTEAKPGQTKGPAYTVGCKMLKLTNGKLMITNIQRGQWSTEDREDRIKATTEADGHSVLVGIEQEPGSGGKESAENTVKNLSGYSVSVEPPQGDKVQRADPFSVQVNWGNVMLLQADWNKAFIDECRFFPFGTFKDQVDAASGAHRMLTSKKQAKVW